MNDFGEWAQEWQDACQPFVTARSSIPNLSPLDATDDPHSWFDLLQNIFALYQSTTRLLVETSYPLSRDYYYWQAHVNRPSSIIYYGVSSGFMHESSLLSSIYRCTSTTSHIGHAKIKSIRKRFNGRIFQFAGKPCIVECNICMALAQLVSHRVANATWHSDSI